MELASRAFVDRPQERVDDLLAEALPHEALDLVLENIGKTFDEDKGQDV
jgi:hypothetical protein